MTTPHPRRRRPGPFRREALKFGGLALVLLAASTTLAACRPATVTPSPSSATTSPSGPPSGGCSVAEQTGVLHSNTLVNVEVQASALGDEVVLTLGDPASNPAGNGTGHLTAAAPPFSSGGSGEEVEILGRRFVEVKLDGMAITDDDGVPTYEGESTLTPDLPALKQVELLEAFEGVYDFILGYDGPGCVTLAADETGRILTITIGH